MKQLDLVVLNLQLICKLLRYMAISRELLEDQNADSDDLVMSREVSPLPVGPDGLVEYKTVKEYLQNYLTAFGRRYEEQLSQLSSDVRVEDEKDRSGWLVGMPSLDTVICMMVSLGCLTPAQLSHSLRGLLDEPRKHLWNPPAHCMSRAMVDALSKTVDGTKKSEMLLTQLMGRPVEDADLMLSPARLTLNQPDMESKWDSLKPSKGCQYTLENETTAVEQRCMGVPSLGPIALQLVFGKLVTARVHQEHPLSNELTVDLMGLQALAPSVLRDLLEAVTACLSLHGLHVAAVYQICSCFVDHGMKDEEERALSHNGRKSGRPHIIVSSQPESKGNATDQEQRQKQWMVIETVCRGFRASGCRCKPPPSQSPMSMSLVRLELLLKKPAPVCFLQQLFAFCRNVILHPQLLRDAQGDQARMAQAPMVHESN